MTTSPHDHLARKVFSRPEEARALFRAFLPEDDLAVIDLDTLALVPETFIDADLADRHTDLLFTVEASGSPLLVYLLFLICRSCRALRTRLEAWTAADESVHLQKAALVSRRRLGKTIGLGLKIVAWATTLGSLYFYVPLMLSFFPETDAARPI